MGKLWFGKMGFDVESYTRKKHVGYIEVGKKGVNESQNECNYEELNFMELKRGKYI